MKLSSVEISGIRGKNFRLAPAHINTLFAPNGTGKSTLQDGIRYGITGLLPKDVEIQPHVAVTLDSGFSFVRDKSCAVNGKKVTLKALNEAIQNETGLTLENIKVTSSADVLLAKKPEDLLAILLEALPEDLTVDMVKKLISNLSQEASDIIDQKFPPMPAKFGVEKLDQVCAELYAERKLKNAELTQKKAIYETVAQIPRPARDIADIEQDLKGALDLEKDSLGSKAAWDAYNAAVLQQKAQNDEIAALEKRVAGDLNVPPITDAQRNSYEEQKARNEKIILDGRASAETFRRNIAVFKDLLASLSTDRCPLSNKIVCQTDKSGLKNETERAIRDNEEQLRITEETLEESQKKTEQLKEMKARFDEVDRITREREQITSRIEVLKTHPVLIPAKPIEVKQGTDVKKLISDLTAEKEAFNAFNSKASLEKEINILGALVKEYTNLMECLKDKGEVKTKFVAHYFQVFETILNERAGQFAPGYEFRFESVNGVMPMLKTPANGGFYPLDALSSGERAIGAFLLMDMLNQLNQTRLMFLDNVEVLDTAALGNLRKLIENPKFNDAYDHIFLMGVNHPEVEKAFDGVGLKVA